MKITVRIPRALYATAIVDLERHHPFAGERIGFFSTSLVSAGPAELIVCIAAYHSIPDDEYIEDLRSGARINSRAIRCCLQRILDEQSGQLHVHIHAHSGPPRPSSMDKRELPLLVRSMVTINPAQVHGGLILSHDAAHATLCTPGNSDLEPSTQISVIGFPFKFLQ